MQQQSLSFSRLSLPSCFLAQHIKILSDIQQKQEREEFKENQQK